MANTIYDKSVFANYFPADDVNVLAWAENVLEKLVAQGIVPKYIQREDDSLGDTDFENYYRPIAIFFGYLVQLSREFETFTDNEFLANEYITQRGGFTCGDESLNELAYVISNSLRIRAQRGTSKMIEPSIDPDIADGEVLRLVCWDELTFFKLGISRPQFNGWNIDHSSPCFRGNTGRYDLNIGYEYSEDIEDLDLYPIVNGNYVFLTRYRGKECIEIEQSVGNAGIGLNDASKRIIVDPGLDFEITFSVAQDITEDNITFGCLAFDIDGNQVDLINSVTGNSSNFFFETRRLNQAGKFYFVRGILFNKNKESLSVDEARLNIGFGHQLVMPETVVSIIPYIVMDSDGSDDSDSTDDNFASDSIDIDSGESGFSDSGYDLMPSIFIWNVKVTPLLFDYERCYLNNKNFIDIILNNKNGRYSNSELNVILRKYFIPYNTPFKVTYLDGVSSTVVTSLILLEDGFYILLEDGDRIRLE